MYACLYTVHRNLPVLKVLIKSGILFEQMLESLLMAYSFPGGACAAPAECMPGQTCVGGVCACDPAMNLFEVNGACVKGIGM